MAILLLFNRHICCDMCVSTSIAPQRVLSFCLRWKIVLHGGIDGYSRLVTFLHASDNNKKETVLRQFLQATSSYGVPSRIRVDKGCENFDICDFMTIIHGVNRTSAIRGTSVHNQRIERLWVDVWNSVTNTYYQLFRFLEDRDMLDPDNNNHIWCLHYCFLNRINESLKVFVDQWNNHGLRTERHSSPIQLFVRQALVQAGDDRTEINELFRSQSSNQSPVGLSGNSSLNNIAQYSNQTQNLVEVPSVRCPLDGNALQRLHISCASLVSDDSDIGLQMYEHVLSFVSRNAHW